MTMLAARETLTLQTELAEAKTETFPALQPLPTVEKWFVKNLFDRTKAFMGARTTASLLVDGSTEMITVRTDELGREVVSYEEVVAKTPHTKIVNVRSFVRPDEETAPEADFHIARYITRSDDSQLPVVEEFGAMHPSDSDFHHLHLAGAALRDAVRLS